MSEQTKSRREWFRKEIQPAALDVAVMTHSTGAWKYPTKPRAYSSRACVFLIALAVAFGTLATAHVAVKAIANLAEFNASQEERQ